MSQKYHRGDVCHIKKELDAMHAHFSSDRDVIILGSYRDQYGGGESGEDHYTVLFCDTGGRCSWYYNWHLDLVRHGNEDDIRAIEAAAEERRLQHSDLAWIVTNWPTIRRNPPDASLIALATLAGYSANDLWGAHGEGIDFWRNATQIYQAFDPILQRGDVDAVKRFGPTVKIKVFSNDFRSETK